jgi:ribosomal-protein-alanine N-acetyltransferase
MAEAHAPFQIVQATFHDLNDLSRLEKACFGSDAWPLVELIAVLTLPNKVRLKAAAAGKMVGFVAGDPQPAQGFAWVTTLCVDAPFRRLGIGRALLRAAEEALGIARVRLTVRTGNNAAIRLYSSEGYREIEHLARYYQDGEDAYVMEKAIPVPDKPAQTPS